MNWYKKHGHASQVLYASKDLHQRELSDCLQGDSNSSSDTLACVTKEKLLNQHSVQGSYPKTEIL